MLLIIYRLVFAAWTANHPAGSGVVWGTLLLYTLEDFGGTVKGEIKEYLYNKRYMTTEVRKILLTGSGKFFIVGVRRAVTG